MTLFEALQLLGRERDLAKAQAGNSRMTHERRTSWRAAGEAYDRCIDVIEEVVGLSIASVSEERLGP